MHKAELIIHEKFPTLNNYTNANRGNIYGGASMKKKYTTIAMLEAKKQIKQKFNKIKIKFEWHEKTRRRDPDNIMFSQKFIIDGLVEAGVIENDGWKQIHSLEHDFIKDNKNFVKLIIESVE